jgi:hypothetical protein
MDLLFNRMAVKKDEEVFSESVVEQKLEKSNWRIDQEPSVESVQNHSHGVKNESNNSKEKEQDKIQNKPNYQVPISGTPEVSLIVESKLYENRKNDNMKLPDVIDPRFLVLDSSAQQEIIRNGHSLRKLCVFNQKFLK